MTITILLVIEFKNLKGFLKKMYVIVLLGPPGAGKGTQGSFIYKKLNLYYISLGLILRKAINEKTILGTKIQNIIQKGDLLSDELISEILKEEIEKIGIENKFLIDGFPRTQQQALILDKIFPKHKKLSILIEISDEMIKKRLLKRSLNENRADDQEQIIKNRIQIYSKNIKDIITFYSQNHYLFKINGNQPIEDIQIEIINYIVSWLKV